MKPSKKELRGARLVQVSGQFFLVSPRGIVVWNSGRQGFVGRPLITKLGTQDHVYSIDESRRFTEGSAIKVVS
jgi:hypothetical protein